MSPAPVCASVIRHPLLLGAKMCLVRVILTFFPRSPLSGPPICKPGKRSYYLTFRSLLLPTVISSSREFRLSHVSPPRVCVWDCTFFNTSTSNVCSNPPYLALCSDPALRWPFPPFSKLFLFLVNTFYSSSFLTRMPLVCINLSLSFLRWPSLV